VLGKVFKAGFGVIFGLIISVAILLLTNTTWAEDYLQLVVLVLVCGLPPVLKFILDNHTSEYLKQLGKDKAVLENIEELTTKVESIKTDFHQDSLALQSKLEVMSGSKLNLQSERVKAVNALFGALYTWAEGIRGAIDITSSEGAEAHVKQALDGRIHLTQQEAFFRLYVDNEGVFTKYLGLKQYITSELYITKVDYSSKIRSKLAMIESGKVSGQVMLPEIKEGLRVDVNDVFYECCNVMQQKTPEYLSQLNSLISDFRAILFEEESSD